MAEFQTKDAVDLYYKQTTIINGLWTVHVAATFAAGGFAALTDKGAELPTRVLVGLFLTVAFLAFTIGNWCMIRAEVGARYVLLQTLSPVLAAMKGSKEPFEPALRVIVDGGSSVAKARLVHSTIDTCVVLAIWARVFLGSNPSA